LPGCTGSVRWPEISWGWGLQGRGERPPHPRPSGCPRDRLGLERAEMGDKDLETGLKEENYPKSRRTKLGLS